VKAAPKKAPIVKPAPQPEKLIIDLPAVVEKKAVSVPVINRSEFVKPGTTGKAVANKIAKAKEKSTKQPVRTVSVTSLEYKVLSAIVAGLYAEAGFSDIEAQDLSKSTKLSVKSIVGVIGSLVKKELIFTDKMTTDEGTFELIYLPVTSYSLHPKWSVEAKEEVAKAPYQVILEIVDAKGEKSSTTVINTKVSVTVVAAKEKTAKTTTGNVSKPYGKYGLHGKNIEVAGLTKGDMVEFEIKKQIVIGEFVHVHVNNHSPEGYAVIKFDGKIYERVLDKIKVVATTQELLPAPAAKKTTPKIANKAQAQKALADSVVTAKK
jgi:DNA-binding MarR family transcriptional regulator